MIEALFIARLEIFVWCNGMHMSIADVYIRMCDTSVKFCAWSHKF